MCYAVPILPEYFFKEHEEQQKLLEFNTTSREGLATIQDQTTTTGEASNQADTTTTTSCHKTGENEYFLKENLYIGILFASKPSVQVIANLLVGPIVDRIGFDLPMLLGIGIMCLSGVRKSKKISYFSSGIPKIVRKTALHSRHFAGLMSAHT